MSGTTANHPDPTLPPNAARRESAARVRGGSWERTLRITVLLLVAGYAAQYLRPFLAPGLPTFWDAHSHLTRAWFAAMALHHGHYPAWSNYWYEGFAPFHIYSPLFYLITGLAELITKDLILSTKLVLWAGQVGGILIFYALLRRLTHDLTASCIGACLLLTSPARIHVLATIGSYPVLIIDLLFPLLSLLALRYADGRTSSTSFVCSHALLLALMFLGHFVDATCVLPGLLAFELVVFGVSRSTSHARLAALVFSIALAVLLSAWALVPAYSDSGQTGLSLDMSRGPHSISAESLLTLAGLRHFSFDHVWLYTLGSPWCILAVATCGASLHRSCERYRPFVVALAVSLVCITCLDERASIALPFIVLPLATGAFCFVGDLVAGFLGHFAKLVFLLAVLGVIIAKSGGSAPVRGFEPSELLAVYSTLPATATRSRTFDVTQAALPLEGLYGASSFSPFFSHRGIPLGASSQGASTYATVSATLLGRVFHDLRMQQPPRLSEDSLNILYLNHVQFLIDRGTKSIFSSSQDWQGTGTIVGGGVLQLPDAAPAVFSSRVTRLPQWNTDSPTGPRHLPALVKTLIAVWASDPVDSERYPSVEVLFRVGARQDWRVLAPWLSAMAIDRARNTASTLLGEEFAAEAEPSPNAVPHFRILEHQEALETATIRMTSTEAGFVRLSYSYDPKIAVTLDGQCVAAYPDVFGATIVAFPQGTHTIELEGRTPTLVVGLLILAATVALALAYFWLHNVTRTRSALR